MAINNDKQGEYMYYFGMWLSSCFDVTTMGQNNTDLLRLNFLCFNFVNKKTRNI